MKKIYNNIFLVKLILNIYLYELMLREKITNNYYVYRLKYIIIYKLIIYFKICYFVYLSLN